MNFFLLLCIPFFAASLVHLLATLFNQKVADITKCFLMPLLALAYIIFSIGNSIENQDVLKIIFLTCALATSCVGDYFLLKPENTNRYYLGVTAFSICHFCFFIPMILQHPLKIYSVWTLIIPIIIYLAFLVAIYFMLKKPKGLMIIFTVGYGAILFLINYACLNPIFGFYANSHTLSTVPQYLWIRLAGNLVFLLSDSILSNTLFVKDFKFSRFFIMITYICAEFLLILSFVL